MSGLGVNANVHSWNNGELKPAIDKISDLGELTWRVIIDKADWETEKNPANLPTIDLNYYATIYEKGKMADLWNTVAYINTKPNQQVMINVMGGVPPWMGGSKIEEDQEDQWVRMIASMVAYGRSIKKLDFQLLAPMNETDWNGIEGPRVDSNQYVRLLHKLIVRLDELGLSDIRMVGPDTASASNANTGYLEALTEDSLVMERMGYHAIHSYGGGSYGTQEVLDESPYPGLDFWVTEFSGPCTNCDSGTPNLSNWQSGAATTAMAIELIKEGAAGLMHYDAWDGYYEHHESMGYWGLLEYDASKGTYTPRKTFYAFMQLTRFVPRGAFRIAASSDDERLAVVAFSDPTSGRITIVGQNNSDSTVETIVRLPGFTGETRFSGFVSDAERDMEPVVDRKTAAGSMAFTSDPDSVFTLTAIPAKG